MSSEEEGKKSPEESPVVPEQKEGGDKVQSSSSSGEQSTQGTTSAESNSTETDNKESTEQNSPPEVSEGGGAQPAATIEEDDSGDELDEAISEMDTGQETVDVDAAILEADPDFQKKIADIDAKDFQGVTISDASSEDDEKVPASSIYRNFLKNLPKDAKKKYALTFILLTLLVSAGVLTFYGYLLPQFRLPYKLKMSELTKVYYTYPTDGVQVPLFDDFHSSAVTVPLPKVTIRLKTDEEDAFGEFAFFLNVKDEDLANGLKIRQSEIVDLIQRALEEVTWKELQSPIGKERVKKIVKHRINEFMQSNVIVGVYYRSVVLSR